MRNYRFFVLLAALAALVVAAPVVREIRAEVGPSVSQLVVTVLFMGLLLSAVIAVARTRRTTRAAVALAIPLGILELLQLQFSNPSIDLLTHLLGIAFLGFVVFVIVRFLFATDHVSPNMIFAAICVYLMLGVLGAIVHSAVETARPASFAMSREGRAAEIQFGGEQSADALYFSFVTLTTLGFGDITPTSPIAKTLVMMEAVIGQLFLAILVARLVGLQISQSVARGPKVREP